MKLKRSLIAILASLFLGFLAIFLYIANEIPSGIDAQISRNIQKEFIAMARTNGLSFSNDAVYWSPQRNSTTLVLSDQLDSNQWQTVKSMAGQLSKLHGRPVTVEFGNHHQLQPEPPSTPAKTQIKGAVYQEMLGKNGNAMSANGLLGAYFLESSPDEKSYLQSLFTNWLPRVEVGATNNVHITKTNVIDRISRKPAKLLWASVTSQSNQIAQAKGGWYLSPVAGANFSYQLVFNGSNWVVTSKKLDLIW